METRGWNWTIIATAAGAIGAVAGLIFTAISTYLGVLVAQDQLAQSRQESEEKIRHQATLVVMWHKRKSWDIHYGKVVISNRSSLPVTDVYSYQFIDGLLYTFNYSDLPPCTEITVDDALLAAHSFPPHEGPVALVGFTDTNGNKWSRSWKGDLVQRQGIPVLQKLLGKEAEGLIFQEMARSMMSPKMKEAKPCEGV
ncbi:MULTISPECIES: hypothetical protein [unclassified Streptomyces]|uniref:hypothetical protein n=1 Tax=unclassified Streptomyces TaxID=2593676 RepID=UPI0033A12D1C